MYSWHLCIGINPWQKLYTCTQCLLTPCFTVKHTSLCYTHNIYRTCSHVTVIIDCLSSLFSLSFIQSSSVQVICCPAVPTVWWLSSHSKLPGCSISLVAQLKQQVFWLFHQFGCWVKTASFLAVPSVWLYTVSEQVALGGDRAAVMCFHSCKR